MFQDLNGLTYDNAFRGVKPRGEDLLLLYDGDAVLCQDTGFPLIFPRVSTVFPQGFHGDFHGLRYGFSLGEGRYFIGDWKEAGPQIDGPTGGEAASGIPNPESRFPNPASGVPNPDSRIPIPESRFPNPEPQFPRGWGFRSSKACREAGPREAVFAAAVGESLHRWYRANRFCGACGGPMEDSKTERALVCPACGQTVYPKICPAVIAAVTDGDRLLLTKYRGRAFKRYALVAGFHEIGESIEDTVRREVFEETGLRVGRVRFYKSQPWVYTDSLLLGFWAELEGSDQITLQTSELSEAGWYTRRELPTDHSPISLTGEMIEVFRRGDGA